MDPNPTNSRPATRIVLIDDHPWIRKGLCALLQTEPGFEVCGEAEDATAAMKVVENSSPDLAIIDISIRGEIDGLELTRRLKSTRPALKVLTLSLHAESEYKSRAIAAGASAYLSKSDVTVALFDTLRQIVEA
jgi:DNA-binding NarL/FixJ family response regulator